MSKRVQELEDELKVAKRRLEEFGKTCSECGCIYLEGVECAFCDNLFLCEDCGSAKYCYLCPLIACYDCLSEEHKMFCEECHDSTQSFWALLMLPQTSAN